MSKNPAKNTRVFLIVEEFEPRLTLDGHGAALPGHDTASLFSPLALVSGFRPGSPVIAPAPTGTVSGNSAERHSGFDRKDFVSTINNPYFPLVPGTTFIYEGTKAGQAARDEFFVTYETKNILGVTTTVIRDRAFLGGQLVEETLDWFAQDEDGNVWYFGEDAKEIQNGVVVSTEGSWQAGVKGAKPGIVMEAHPQIGDSYHQELAKGVAEDQATVLSLDRKVTVPFGSFSNCLQTKEFSRLSPGDVEYKFYAPGVGFIRAVSVDGSEVLELVGITTTA